MMDSWLWGGLVAGCILALLVEVRRRSRLRLRIAHELELLASVLDRRRAQLVHLGVQLPKVLPACHVSLEVLGRSHRASADALLDWRGQLESGAAATRLRGAETTWGEGLRELQRESPEEVQALASLALLQARSHELRLAAEDAQEHLRLRSVG